MKTKYNPINLLLWFIILLLCGILYLEADRPFNTTHGETKVENTFVVIHTAYEVNNYKGEGFDAAIYEKSKKVKEKE